MLQQQVRKQAWLRGEQSGRGGTETNTECGLHVSKEPCDVQVNHLEHFSSVSAQLQNREREQQAGAVWELLKSGYAWEGTCAPGRLARPSHYNQAADM